MLRKLSPWNFGVEIVISITKFAYREEKQSEDENLTSQEGIRLRWRELVFAEKKETKTSEVKCLSPLKILKSKKKQRKN